MDCITFLSGNRTLITSFVGCLLIQGELILQKWPVVLESAMDLAGGRGGGGISGCREHGISNMGTILGTSITYCGSTTRL